MGKSAVDVAIRIPVPPSQVIAVLGNGWTYACWVVGASHIRAVDAGWPNTGSRIHHSVGPWPLMVRDVTKVSKDELPRTLELDARAWPFGAAWVRFDIEEITAGVTEVRMSERAVRGPIRFIPYVLQVLLLRPRNVETLQRLKDIVVHADY